MTELRGFWTVDLYDEELSPEVIEIVEFLYKMDSEGGLSSMVNWGGAEVFPEPLRELATKYAKAENELQAAIIELATQRGIQA